MGVVSPDTMEVNSRADRGSFVLVVGQGMVGTSVLVGSRSRRAWMITSPQSPIPSKT